MRIRYFARDRYCVKYIIEKEPEYLSFQADDVIEQLQGRDIFIEAIIAQELDTKLR